MVKGAHMHMEYVDCNYCGSNKFSFFCSAKSHYGPEIFQVVRCEECDLIFVNPRLANKAEEISKRVVKRVDPREFEDPRRKIRDKFVLKKVSQYKTTGNFLDFGCGGGSLVREASCAGWNAFGLELNKALAESANAYWGGERILSYSLDELKHQFAGYFDVINSSRVFEHLTDPLGTARSLVELLREGGIFSLDVPNIFDLKSYLRRSAAINPTGHLYHFSAKTIRQLLIKAGFTIVQLKNSFSGVHLIGKIVKNPELASDIAHLLYRLPTYGFGLSVVAMRK